MNWKQLFIGVHSSTRDALFLTESLTVHFMPKYIRDITFRYWFWLNLISRKIHFHLFYIVDIEVLDHICGT